MVLRDMARRSYKAKPRFITSRNITSRSITSRIITSRLPDFFALEKGGHEASGLIGLARLATGADPGLHGLADRHALPVAHQLFLYPDCAGARRQYGGNPLLDGFIQPGRLDDFLQKAAAIGLRCRELIARIDQLAGLAPPDELGQQAGLHAGRDAEAHLGHPELRGGDADA